MLENRYKNKKTLTLTVSYALQTNIIQNLPFYLTIAHALPWKMDGFLSKLESNSQFRHFSFAACFWKCGLTCVTHVWPNIWALNGRDMETYVCSVRVPADCALSLWLTLCLAVSEPLLLRPMRDRARGSTGDRCFCNAWFMSYKACRLIAWFFFSPWIEKDSWLCMKSAKKMKRCEAKTALNLQLRIEFIQSQLNLEKKQDFSLASYQEQKSLLVHLHVLRI